MILAHSLPLRLTKKWTIIQYNDADNELGVYARDDIREMMVVGSDSNVNMVVLYDTWAEGAAPYYIVNGGAYRITKGPDLKASSIWAVSRPS